MEELDASRFVKQKTKLEIRQQKKQEFKYVYQGTIIPHENHTLFEVCPTSLTIVEAEYEKTAYIFNPIWKKGNRISSELKVVMKPGFVYISALNKENALKKFKKGSNGTKINPTKSYLQL
jgi:hypothetical protein